MGLFDFLFSDQSSEERRLESLEDSLTNMYVQDSERKHAIRQLRDMETREATQVLLERFKETAPNTTVDVEEKELAYDLLVDLGRNSDLPVADIVMEYLAESEEKVNWPIKVLKDLLDYDEMVDAIIELLDTCPDGYKDNPEKKQELMLQSSEVKSPELAEKLLPFLEDSNETIRFLAVDAVAHQDEDDLVEEPLRERLREEDSLRIVKKIVEIFAEHRDWKIPEDEQAEVEKALPEEYGIHKEGHVYEKRI